MLARATSFEGLNESRGPTFEVPQSDGWQVGTTCWPGILALLQLGPSTGLLPFPYGLAAETPRHQCFAFYSLASEIIHLHLYLFIGYIETKTTMIHIAFARA